ncbi:unnamed protein product [Anisakis simplex]|uniref:HTH CENPB-type domain-containing protein n=1 Tax=Anisakis simplex TaxID=6269 RepID=A0A0M3IYN6_ANISI|nr:unnamed protein product [Anisakis simplex]
MMKSENEPEDVKIGAAAAAAVAARSKRRATSEGVQETPLAKKLQREKVPISIKKDIIAKHEAGMSYAEIAKLYRRSTSTIGSIYANKEKYMNVFAAEGVSVLTKRRTKSINDVEQLLLTWIKQRALTGEHITETMIRDKARCLHLEMIQLKSASKSDEEIEAETFKASRGWLDNFLRRNCIRITSSRSRNVSGDLNCIQIGNGEVVERDDFTWNGHGGRCSVDETMVSEVLKEAYGKDETMGLDKRIKEEPEEDIVSPVFTMEPISTSIVRSAGQNQCTDQENTTSSHEQNFDTDSEFNSHSSTSAEVSTRKNALDNSDNMTAKEFEVRLVNKLHDFPSDQRALVRERLENELDILFARNISQQIKAHFHGDCQQNAMKRLLSVVNDSTFLN